jgi:hypothetical protein
MKKLTTASADDAAWKNLYSLIQEFIQAGPWKLFENEDVFIVQSPRDNQIYLCCVMGNGGEEFGLNAFRGAPGMRSFYKMIARGGSTSPDRSLMYEFDMLSFSLAPRDFMEKNDLQVTKKLKLSFSGGNWPFIRSYRPHYFPWFLTVPEIETLGDCLEQTLALYAQGETALHEIRNAARGEMLVRHMTGSAWSSHKVRIGYPLKDETPEIHLDDFTIQRLLNLPATGMKEEIDLVHLPGAIKDHEPPYFGLVLLGINEQPLANPYGTFPPFLDYFQASCDKLAQTFLSRGSKPSLVILKDGSPFADVFEKFAQKVAIKYAGSAELPYIADFLNSLDQSMADGGFPQAE